MMKERRRVKGAGRRLRKSRVVVAVLEEEVVVLNVEINIETHRSSEIRETTKIARIDY